MGAVLVAFVTALLIGLYRIRNVGRRPSGLPPGPPTWPIIGNLHLMPKEKAHLQFKKWAEEYGPVYSLILGTSVMVVLSSDTAVKDLLDKRSNIYSSRPDLYLGQLISGGLRMLLMEYGDQWRMIRRTVHNHLNIRAAKSYIPYQDMENRNMLVGFLDQPERYVDHLRRYTNALTTQMVFGFRTTDIDDPKMHQLFDGFRDFCEVINSPTAALIDVFPFLKYLPDALIPLKRKAKELHKRERELYVGHWLNVKQRIKAGTAKPCICVDLVNSQSTEKFSDDLAGYISGSLLEAGSDTTFNTLVGWMQAMVLFPDVQRTAQAEVDRVCGDRYPTMDDEPDMQYIRSNVKESMRWMPTGILGIPHAVIKDDMYNGWKIPKGAGIILNVWGIHNDPERWPNPRQFDPTRYLHDKQSAAEAALNSDPKQRDHFVFGAGRRICQGMHIAERSLFLAIVRLLWAFDISKAADANGVEITPDPNALTEGLIVLPLKFPAKITPRTAEKADLVRQEWAKMEEKLDGEKQWKEVPEGMFSKEYVPLKA